MQIIQEFFIITTPIVKLFAFFTPCVCNLSDKILTALLLNFVILAKKRQHYKKCRINKMRFYGC